MNADYDDAKWLSGLSTEGRRAIVLYLAKKGEATLEHLSRNFLSYTPYHLKQTLEPLLETGWVFCIDGVYYLQDDGIRQRFRHLCQRTFGAPYGIEFHTDERTLTRQTLAFTHYGMLQLITAIREGMPEDERNKRVNLPNGQLKHLVQVLYRAGILKTQEVAYLSGRKPNEVVLPPMAQVGRFLEGLYE